MTMMKPLPDALRAPITDMASAKAWIQALVAADMAFHFEDDPADIICGPEGVALFDPADVPLIRERVASLYSLEWGPRPGLGYWYCPIGYMASVEPFNPENQAPGCLPGVSEYWRHGAHVVRDCGQTADYTYGEPGRYTLTLESGDEKADGLIGAYDTPDEAMGAAPGMLEAWNALIAGIRARRA